MPSLKIKHVKQSLGLDEEDNMLLACVSWLCSAERAIYLQRIIRMTPAGHPVTGECLI